MNITAEQPQVPAPHRKRGPRKRLCKARAECFPDPQIPEKRFKFDFWLQADGLHVHRVHTRKASESVVGWQELVQKWRQGDLFASGNGGAK